MTKSPCLLLIGIGLLAFAHSAHAQSASAVFTGPQNMDPGLQNGLNNLTGYIYSILKFLSLIGLGVAYYFVMHHGGGEGDPGDRCGRPSLVRPRGGQHRPEPRQRRRPGVGRQRDARGVTDAPSN